MKYLDDLEQILADIDLMELEQNDTTEYVKKQSINTKEKKENNQMVANSIDIKTLNKQVLDANNEKLTTVQRGDGIALLKNYSKGTTTSGNPFFSGVISNIEEIQFKVWENKPAFNFLENTELLAGESVVKISYEVGKYGCVINSMELLDGYNPDDFINYKYDISEKGKEFADAIKASGATQKAKDIIKMILHIESKDEIMSRFCREYAGLSHHDNCRAGLLAHTTKCIEIYNGIKPCYEMFKNERENDLMVIALVTHDIGKIFEMHNGTYQKFSFLTHRVLGMEYLIKYENAIIEAYDKEFYEMLISVVTQHHDEYGEDARTVCARLVHMIDNMDAEFSSINEKIQGGEYTTDESGTKIKLNDRYLYIFER